MKEQSKMQISSRLFRQQRRTGYRKVFELPVYLWVILLPFTVFSQQTGEPKDERTEQVTIIGTYDPSINPAFKINTRPEMNDFILEKQEFEFSPLNLRTETIIESNTIEPPATRFGRRATAYNNFLKLGFGSQISPLVDFYHSSGDRNDYRLNVNLNHYSSFQDIPDYSPSPFSNSLIGIGYEKYAGEAVFSLGAGYGLDMYRYFGFKPKEYPEYDPPEDDLKQSFNLIELNLGVRSNNRKKDDVEYDVRLEAYYFFDRWEKNETNIDLAFDVAKPFATASRDDFQKFGIRGNVVFGLNNDSLINTNDLILEGIPYFKAKYGVFSFNAGFNFSYLMADSSVFRFYPAVNLAINALPEVLTIYAGAGGGMYKNRYYSLTRENPWVAPIIPVVWTNQKLRIYAGVKGNIASKLGYNVEITWQSFENLPFFINTNDSQFWPSSEPLNKFTLYTDNGSLFGFSGEITYTIGEAFDLWLDGFYHNYSLDNLEQPFHKPLLRAGIGGSYLLKKKVKFWTELFTIGKRYALDNQTAEIVELDGFLDINLGVDYLVTERLTIFANGTNLLNTRYDRFMNYPVQGLQVMAGVGVRF